MGEKEEKKRRLIMKMLNRLLLLSFLVLVLGLYSGCNLDGAGAGGAGASPQLLATVYVDASASPSGDGTSWTKAFNNLQAGINAAADKVSGNGYVRVHVAKGTYKPTSRPNNVNPSDPRAMHFSLRNGVYVIGGYPGLKDDESKEVDPSKTILSGEGATTANPYNAYHVFYHPKEANLTSSAKLENVTITKGNANGTGQDDKGGGMYNEGSSPTLKNVIFENNEAVRHGGGMYNTENSSPTLTDCIFTGNTATEYGGGMYNRDSNPTLTVDKSERTSFAHNTAKSGGGIYNTGSSPTLNGVTFQSNEAAEYGGGIANFENSEPKLDIYCRFEEAEPGAKQNTAGEAGGGMYADATSNPKTTLDSGDKEASKTNGYYKATQ